MKRLTAPEFEHFVAQHRVLYGTPERPGLMLTQDGLIVKSFYQRKTISTSTFIPQAKRFAANSRKLLNKGIPAPVVEDVIYCDEVPVHMVVYKMLDGEDVRRLCENKDLDVLAALTGFLAHLHDEGVYFRAIHLGNLLRRPDGTFAVLDISDLTTRSGPLGLFRRARNLAHLMNAGTDKAWFARYGIKRFLDEYLAHTGIRAWRRWLLEKRFMLALDKELKRPVSG